MFSQRPVFEIQSHDLLTFVPSVFVCRDTLKLLFIQFHMKINRHFTNAFLCLSNYSQPPPPLHGIFESARQSKHTEMSCYLGSYLDRFTLKMKALRLLETTRTAGRKKQRRISEVCYLPTTSS
jgi:hypothetical protein